MEVSSMSRVAEDSVPVPVNKKVKGRINGLGFNRKLSQISVCIGIQCRHVDILGK